MKIRSRHKKDREFKDILGYIVSLYSLSGLCDTQPQNSERLEEKRRKKRERGEKEGRKENREGGKEEGRKIKTIRRQDSTILEWKGWIDGML